jgi:molybdate transport system ATP-binding protein
VSLRELPIGHAVRVRILARDVSIALERPQHSSISNILPARIIDIMPSSATAAIASAQALVRLDVAGSIVLARITRRSVALLDLKPDMQVYAQVKSVALMG